MFTLNEAWASTSSDLVIQGKQTKALDARVAALESEHCSPRDLDELERITRTLDMKIQDVASKADATAVRSFQAAFFSDTLLQALEDLYKSPQNYIEPGATSGGRQDSGSAALQASTDLAFLLKNALQSVASLTAVDEKKMDSILESKLASVGAKMNEEVVRHRREHSLAIDELSRRVAALPRDIRQDILGDREMLRSIAVHIPMGADDPVFKANVEAVTEPLLQGSAIKVSLVLIPGITPHISICSFIFDSIHTYIFCLARALVRREPFKGRAKT
jgi:hypothetical protein